MTNKKPTIEVITEKTLTANTEQTVDVLIRITPPEIEQAGSKRPKLNLSMVLDRSGSMSGRKIEEARQSAKYCIDQLLATDRISTVIFDDQVDVLIPSQPVENKELLKRAIHSVVTAGSTALHEAWVRGGLEVSDHLEGTAINRVLLITDGQANVGETSVNRIVEQARELAAKGVTTSTIGIGEDFNEDLLMPMAEAGRGNAWHVQEPQDMVRIFETELKGLVSQHGHTVRLAIEPAAGVTVADVLNDFETDTTGRCILPNLLASSPLEIVVRMRVPSYNVCDEADLANVALTYVEQTSNVPITMTAPFRARFDSPETVAALDPNLDVIEAVQLLMNARARQEAIAQMDVGNFAACMDTFKSVAQETEIAFSLVASPRLEREREELAELEQAMESRENYSSTRKRMAYGRESIRKGK
ncbi:MAG TPA: VWA domain-containing protein [Pyrinomonadaceae bacterium]|nr:VWA domain-containing protein [Pyrinomonadaceae bacterium]